MEEMYTIREVAEMLKISVSSMYRYVEAGKFPHKKIGTNIRFTSEHINEFLENKNQENEAKSSICPLSPAELQAVYDEF